MKINKTCKDGEIFIGDLFHFDYKKILDTPFSNSNFAAHLIEKDADEAYIHVNFDPQITLNVPSYNIYYVKDNKIIEQGFENTAVFFSYIMGKETEGVFNRIGNYNETNLDVATLLSRNDYVPPVNLESSITDKSLNITTSFGENVQYGDIVKLNYDLLKEEQKGEKKILNQAFLDKLDSFGVQEIYFHITDIKNSYKHCFSSPKIYIYAVSESGLKNGKTDEENANDLEYFKESNQPNRKLDTYFQEVDGGINILEKLNAKGIFEKITGNTNSVELELDDVVGKPARRLKM